MPILLTEGGDYLNSESLLRLSTVEPYLVLDTAVAQDGRASTFLALKWSNVDGALSYDIERNGVVVATGLTGTTYTDSGLTAATAYTYRVRAVLESFVDFTSATFGGLVNQDAGTVTVFDSGTRLEFANNAWKNTTSLGPHVITASTVLELEVRVDPGGIDIVGVAFVSNGASDINFIAAKTFQFYGSQSWGAFQQYSYTAGEGNWQSFLIPVGSHYTGTFTEWWFIGDDDAAPLATWAVRNVRVYESA